MHFFWGSFDLAVTRFSGRTAPERPGVDAFDGLRRVEEGRFTSAGPATADIHTGSHGILEYDNRNA